MEISSRYVDHTSSSSYVFNVDLASSTCKPDPLVCRNFLETTISDQVRILSLCPTTNLHYNNNYNSHIDVLGDLEQLEPSEQPQPGGQGGENDGGQPGGASEARHQEGERGHWAEHC